MSLSVEAYTTICATLRKNEAKLKAAREALEKIRDEGGPDFTADDMIYCASAALKEINQ